MDSRGSGPGKGSDVVQTSPSSEDNSASNPMDTRDFSSGVKLLECEIDLPISM